MTKQFALKQTSEESDWLIGAGMFLPHVKAKALRSMKAPGTAFDDPRLGGADDQPDHMDRYVNLPLDDDPKNDNGGVHINSGIPNKAFFLTAVGLGGSSWEKAGPIWYKTQLDPRLKIYAADENNWDTCFAYFAGLTVANAASEEDRNVVKRAWQDVGVQPALV
jgi:Zn-dependent metalloprotease